MSRIARRTFGVVDLSLEVVARSDHREVDLDASADSKANLVTRMTLVGRTGERRSVVTSTGVMQCAHDLRTAPGLIDAKIGDDVRHHNLELVGTRQRTNDVWRVGVALDCSRTRSKT